MYAKQLTTHNQPFIHILTSRKSNQLRFVPAQLNDCDAVVRLFGALHAYNTSLDSLFALSDEWETILREEFARSYNDPGKMWLVVKDGDAAVGLLIAAVHSDSPMFRHRQWVEVEGLYVADSHRRMGIAKRLLTEVYAWGERLNLPRVQLYVTASNLRAKFVYEDEGFSASQVIMRKRL